MDFSNTGVTFVTSCPQAGSFEEKARDESVSDEEVGDAFSKIFCRSMMFDSVAEMMLSELDKHPHRAELAVILRARLADSSYPWPD